MNATHLALIAAVVLLAAVPLLYHIVRARRKAARLAAIERTCSNCRHFDLEEGQAAMDKFPIWRQAAQWIPPSELGRRVVDEVERPCRACDGTGNVRLPHDVRVGTEVQTQPCVPCEGTGKQKDEVFSKPSAGATSAWENYGACLRDEVVVDGADTVQIRFSRRANEMATGEAAVDCFEHREDAA